MGLLEKDVTRVQRWCRGHTPDQLRNEVRVEVDVADRHTTLEECRPTLSALASDHDGVGAGVRP